MLKSHSFTWNPAPDMNSLGLKGFHARLLTLASSSSKQLRKHDTFLDARIPLGIDIDDVDRLILRCQDQVLLVYSLEENGLL